MLESDARARIVSEAQKLLVTPGAERVVKNTYNAQHQLPRSYPLSQRDPWCAGTITVLGIRAGMAEIIPGECSCPLMIEKFKRLGCWVEADTYRPSIGDIPFYDWQDSGRGDNVGVADHVGIVARVEGDKITVIEGNKRDQMGTRHIFVGSWGLRGYGTPDYRGFAIDTSVDKLAMLQVINSPGFWKRECRLGNVRYLAELIGRATNVITRSGPRCSSAGEALERLVNAGIINTPTYWAGIWPQNQNISHLLMALGGCV